MWVWDEDLVSSMLYCQNEARWMKPYRLLLQSDYQTIWWTLKYDELPENVLGSVGDQGSLLKAPKKLWEMATRLSSLTIKWWWMRAGANTELTTFSRFLFHDTHEALPPHNYARFISICTTWHGTIRMNLGLIGVARSASVRPGMSAQSSTQTQLCSRQGQAWDRD